MSWQFRGPAIKKTCFLSRSPVVAWIVEESGGGLDLVEVEGVVAGHGAVEPGLEEGGPPVPELVGASLVVLANSSNPRVNLLATVHELNCRLPA